MVKTVFAIYLMVFPLAKLGVTWWLYYNDQMGVPWQVVYITVFACLGAMVLTVYSLMCGDGKKMRIALGVLAGAALANMAITVSAQVEIFDSMLLWVIGTFFDPLMFIASLTLKMENSIKRADIFLEMKH